MIIYINEDTAYLAWVRHHHDGFVLDAYRTASPRRRPTLHRARCASIRTGRRPHWTTGPHLKACSLNREELVDWGRHTSAPDVVMCQQCRPDEEASAVPPECRDPATFHLTPLTANVLNYVLESTVVQLTNRDPDYRLTVGDIARCLGKTAPQLRQALEHLAAAGLLRFSAPARKNRAFSPRTAVAPTAAALGTLPAYAGASSEELQTEINGLGPIDFQ